MADEELTLRLYLRQRRHPRQRQSRRRRHSGAARKDRRFRHAALLRQGLGRSGAVAAFDGTDGRESHARGQRRDRQSRRRRIGGDQARFHDRCAGQSARLYMRGGLSEPACQSRWSCRSRIASARTRRSRRLQDRAGQRANQLRSSLHGPGGNLDRRSSGVPRQCARADRQRHHRCVRRHVNLEVVLPWLLAKVAEAIQPLIRHEGTLMLEKK